MVWHGINLNFDSDISFDFDFDMHLKFKLLYHLIFCYLIRLYSLSPGFMVSMIWHEMPRCGMTGYGMV